MSIFLPTEGAVSHVAIVIHKIQTKHRLQRGIIHVYSFICVFSTQSATLSLLGATKILRAKPLKTCKQDCNVGWSKVETIQTICDHFLKF